MPDPRLLVGGRSNRVWRAGALVVKLYNPAAANLLFANDMTREAQALAHLAGTGLAPELLGQGKYKGQGWLIYRHLEAQPWSRATGAVADLLGRLHRIIGWEALPEQRGGSAELAAQAKALLRGVPEGEDLLSRAPKGLAEVAPVSRPCLVHGDPVPGNLMVCDASVMLIDWQCPRRGDPAEDLALFLSPAMQQIYRGAPLSMAEEAAFLGAYPEPAVVARYRALRPWFHWRMAAYCLWRGDRAAMALEMASLRSTIDRIA